MKIFGKKMKTVLKILILLLFIVVLIHIFVALTLGRSLQYKEIPFHSSKVPAEMNGYKIAFISDTHAISAKELEGIVSRVNQWQTDLVVLGGDFPSIDDAPKRSMEILSKIESPDGIFGVEGNHDNYATLFAAMEEYGMHPLSNSGIYPREHFYVAGVEDLWNHEPNIEKAIAGTSADDFVLLLAHNPDVTMQQNTTGVDLILSGHTHGGQITFFGVWAPALTLRKNITDYGQRFMSGWAQSHDGTPVYVSNGAGTFSGIPRVFARPQVILITLYFGDSAYSQDH